MTNDEISDHRSRARLGEACGEWRAGSGAAGGRTGSTARQKYSRHGLARPQSRRPRSSHIVYGRPKVALRNGLRPTVAADRWTSSGWINLEKSGRGVGILFVAVLKSLFVKIEANRRCRPLDFQRLNKFGEEWPWKIEANHRCRTLDFQRLDKFGEEWPWSRHLVNADLKSIFEMD
ncbi:hypothetical protein J6590_003767 [Homalodisca vitripennis]|nr:hypothetical protein J6590_003767 [Homalodisca vitripennis]